MSMVLMKALKPTTYENRTHEKGGEFSATASHARILSRLGRAEVITRELVSSSSSEESPERTKRRYRRRDLTAE